LPAQVDSLLAVAEVSHRDMCAVIREHACGGSAETATCASDQGDAIM
jgi:hypothetical protein